MPINFDNINNQTHEILRNIPKWYIRFGSLILLFVFLLILWVSTQVNYPVYYQSVGMVYPSSEKNTLVFKCKIPQELMTKIKEKSKIKVSLVSFPENSFGSIDSEISSIDQPTSSSSEFEVHALMQPQVITNMNREIQVKPFYKGKAKILIQEESLFRQLFK